jgi:hypothetical protein
MMGRFFLGIVIVSLSVTAAFEWMSAKGTLGDIGRRDQVRCAPDSGHRPLPARRPPKCQERKSVGLFDHFVGAGEQRRRHV